MTSTFKSPYPPVAIPETSIWQHVFKQGAKYPGTTPAYIDAVTGASVNRGTFEQECLLLASALRQVDKKGLVALTRGSVVTIFSPNSFLYPRVQLALTAAGICGAFANSAYVGNELAHAYKISSSSHMLVHPTLVPVAVDTLKKHLGFAEQDIKRRVIIMAYKKDVPAQLAKQGLLDIDDVLAGCKPLASLPERFDGKDAQSIASIYFSSGTTGLSKAVGLSHYNLVAFMSQVAASWPYYVHGRDILQVTVPIFHALGGLVLVLYGFFIGVPVVILPGFQPELFLESIQKYKITHLAIVPPLFNFIVSHPLSLKYDLSSLRHIMVGAAPIAPAAFPLARKVFEKRGMRVEIVQGYGLTETSSTVSFNPVEHMEKNPASVGCVFANCEGRLVDDEGNVVPQGEPGELWVKGPNIMKEYVGNPQATRESLTADGYFKTGDVMVVDESGFLTVVDRKKELIKYKGLQVAPAELEAVLFTCPDVADAGVIGVYSEKDVTEVPLAYVVPKNPDLLKSPEATQNATKQQIHAWMKDKLAPYKALRGGIVFVQAIPRSAAGKILRKDLRSLRKSQTEKARL